MKKKVIIVKNGRFTREKCVTCGQLIPTKKPERVKSQDIRRLLEIMEKYGLSQTKLATKLSVSQPTVSAWFSKSENPKGKINEKYFMILHKKGFV